MKLRKILVVMLCLFFLIGCSGAKRTYKSGQIVKLKVNDEAYVILWITANGYQMKSVDGNDTYLDVRESELKREAEDSSGN